MNAIIHDPTPQLDRMASAAEWLQRLHDRRPDSQTWIEWQQWQADPNNRAAFEKLLRVWCALDHPILRRSLRTSTAPSTTRQRVSWTAQWLPRTVAFLLAFICNALLASLFFVGDATPTERVYTIDRGGFGRFTLPDGTVLEINTDSRVRLQGSATHTTARLERGEAFFQSAPHARNPIRVIAGTELIADVTGAADIRLREDNSVALIVQTGAVELSDLIPPTSPAAIELPSNNLKLNQAATIHNGQASIHTIDRDALECRLAWRTRTICSQGDTVADIVRELNRYNHTKVVIIDSTIGTLRVGGRFYATSPDDFIELIDQVFPGRVVARSTDNEIHLFAQK